jgi:hypothetical protein
MKVKFILTGYLLILALCVRAQDGSVTITPIYDDEYLAQNFCSGVMQLLGDAANKFGKTKGKEIETHGDVAIWSSNTGMPGAITSSLLFTTSWRYEGVVYQGASEMELRAAHKKYNDLLAKCMEGKGYFASSEQNADPKLESFPALAYTKSAEGKQHSPYASLVTTYVEQTNTYTLSVNIWE